MEICNLMIGDWVEVTQTECVADGGHYITWSEYGKVIGITDSYIEVEVRDGEYNVDAHEDELKSIPLTDEILKKNGFDYENNVGDVLEYYNYEIIYNTWEHELRILENREQILKIKTFDEMCVHELQHALRLCGIDKEIEI